MNTETTVQYIAEYYDEKRRVPEWVQGTRRSFDTEEEAWDYTFFWRDQGTPARILKVTTEVIKQSP